MPSTFKGFDKDPSYKTDIWWHTSSNSSKSCEIIIIDTPFCDNSTIVFLINASEPASIPHVGWDKIYSSGFDLISLPIINFCRFPPESLPALTL